MSNTEILGVKPRGLEPVVGGGEHKVVKKVPPKIPRFEKQGRIDQGKEGKKGFLAGTEEQV